jgi:hypothetical protein
MRVETLRRFERASGVEAGEQPLVYASYSNEDRVLVEAIAERLVEHRVALWSSKSSKSEGAFERSQVVLFFVGATGLDEQQQSELSLTLGRNKPLLPVLLGDAEWSFPTNTQVRIGRQRHRPDPVEIFSLLSELFHLLRRSRPVSPYPEDPQKGLWGGRSRVENRELTAAVRPITDDYFEITLEVRTMTAVPLVSDVEFHLHPIFAKSVQAVKPVDGRATLKVLAWGAFTVGVLADNGRTKLELDLTEDPSFPQAFTAR